MNNKLKWSLYQLVAIIVLIGCIIILHRWMNQLSMPTDNIKSLSILGGILFLLIT